MGIPAQPVDRLLRGTASASAVIFGLLCFGMTAVWIEGIRDDERLVVCIVTACSIVAFGAAIRVVQGAIAWTPVLGAAAAGLSLAVYLGESELRNNMTSGYSLLFISLPVVLSLLLAIGFRRTLRARRAVPEARVH